jgi:cysteine desulfurase
MKRIYLDHAAATPVDPRVHKAMEPFWSEAYGNPGAIHAEGVASKKAVNDARKKIATELGVHADEIIFTGSATESCNLALIGTVRAWQKAHDAIPHIIVSAIEHDAVLGAAQVLEAKGVRVTRLSVNSEGLIDLEVLKEAFTKETVLVSVMYANNEIGTIEPIKEIAKAIRKWKKDVRGVVRDAPPSGDDIYPLFHTDACQAANYCDMRIPTLGVDLLTMNSAKIYGPKGVGLLFAARGTPLVGVIVGGGQERGFRGGTENVPAIVGFAEAFLIARGIAAKESQRLTEIRDYTIDKLEKIEGLIVNGSKTERLPNNINFSLPHVDHEFIVLALDARGIAVATKSACNEQDAETSHVLVALRQQDTRFCPLSGIRLSLGRATTQEDIDVFIDALLVIQSTMIVPE